MSGATVFWVVSSTEGLSLPYGVTLSSRISRPAGKLDDRSTRLQVRAHPASIHTMKRQQPSGPLPCDGSTYTRLDS